MSLTINDTNHYMNYTSIKRIRKREGPAKLDIFHMRHLELSSHPDNIQHWIITMSASITGQMPIVSLALSFNSKAIVYQQTIFRSNMQMQKE